MEWEREKEKGRGFSLWSSLSIPCSPALGARANNEITQCIIKFDENDGLFPPQTCPVFTNAEVRVATVKEFTWMLSENVGITRGRYVSGTVGGRCNVLKIRPPASLSHRKISSTSVGQFQSFTWSSKHSGVRTDPQTDIFQRCSGGWNKSNKSMKKEFWDTFFYKSPSEFRRK